jgi:hypothetical protein
MIPSNEAESASGKLMRFPESIRGINRREIDSQRRRSINSGIIDKE